MTDAKKIAKLKTENQRKCARNGVKWFKLVGSYPILQAKENKGKKAVDVACERCERDENSFPDSLFS